MEEEEEQEAVVLDELFVPVAVLSAVIVLPVVATAVVAAVVAPVALFPAFFPAVVLLQVVGGLGVLVEAEFEFLRKMEK